jgi:DNA-directed RNA polymerase subunit K/omega
VKFFLDESEKNGKSNSFNNFNLIAKIMAKRKEKTVEDLGPFQLTSLLIRRTRELMNGSPALVEVDSSEPVQTAFEELTDGKLNITTEEDVTKD